MDNLVNSNSIKNRGVNFFILITGDKKLNQVWLRVIAKAKFGNINQTKGVYGWLKCKLF